MDQIPNDPAILATIPAIPPPPGVIPNFENPYSLAPIGRAVLGVTFPLMIIAIASRLYTRLWVTRSIGPDDYLSVAATASVIAYFGVTMSVLGNPLGPHMWNVPLSTVTPRYIRGVIVISDLYSASAMLLKTSLLVLYLRLFRTDRIMNVLIWTGIATIVVFYSVCIIATSIFCRSSQWPETTNPAEFLLLQAQSDCNGPQLNLASTQGVFSTVSDIYVLVLPIRLIWNLRLSQRRKIGICSILLVGLIATACSIGTMYTRFAQRNSIDFNWDSALNIILGGLELQVGVICNCMPISFIIFKRASSTSWTTIRRYWNLRYRRKDGSTTAIGSDEPKLPQSQDGVRMQLPKVPRATLTGLRTLLGGTRGKDATQSAELRTYSELNSINDDYHAQLKTANVTDSLQSQPQRSEVTIPHYPAQTVTAMS